MVCLGIRILTFVMGIRFSLTMQIWQLKEVSGCGKCTMLKLMMGLEKPHRGEVLLGEHNVLPNYLEQNQVEALDLEKKRCLKLWQSCRGLETRSYKRTLGHCNFMADMLGKKVPFLSGGERINDDDALCPSLVCDQVFSGIYLVSDKKHYYTFSSPTC